MVMFATRSVARLSEATGCVLQPKKPRESGAKATDDREVLQTIAPKHLVLSPALVPLFTRLPLPNRSPAGRATTTSCHLQGCIP